MPNTNANAGGLDTAQWVSQAQAMQSWLAAGGSVGDVLQAPREQREALYQLGYGFYAQGRYEDAFKVFSLLVVHEHMNERYLMALAGAAQMIGRHRDALQHYSTAALLLIGDPRPVFFSAECLMALKHFDLAAESLRLVIELAGESTSHGVLKSRATALLASIKHQSRASGGPGNPAAESAPAL